MQNGKAAAMPSANFVALTSPRAAGAQGGIDVSWNSELALARLVYDALTPLQPEVSRPRALALLLALRPEATRMALLAAVSANVANAIAAGVPGAQARALTRFFPGGTSKLTLASTRYRRFEPAAAVSAALEVFHEDLAAGINQTLGYVASGWDHRLLQAEDGEGLVWAWRKVCGSAYRLLEAIDLALSTFHIVGPADASDALMSLLRSAENGGTELMQSDGCVTLPEWAEARRSPRVKVDCDAIMMIGSERHPIRFLDISTGGAGVQVSKPVGTGERVVIIVDQSMVLPGSVVWSQEGRAGIVFETPLVDDAPALRFLTRP